MEIGAERGRKPATSRNTGGGAVNQTCRREFVVRMDRGLHLRPGIMLVKTACRFSAEMAVSKGDTTVCGKSLLSLLVLRAEQGSRLRVVAAGPDAEALMGAIGGLFDCGFGESCADFELASLMMDGLVAG